MATDCLELINTTCKLINVYGATRTTAIEQQTLSSVRSSTSSSKSSASIGQPRKELPPLAQHGQLVNLAAQLILRVHAVSDHTHGKAETFEQASNVFLQAVDYLLRGAKETVIKERQSQQAALFLIQQSPHQPQGGAEKPSSPSSLSGGAKGGARQMKPARESAFPADLWLNVDCRRFENALIEVHKVRGMEWRNVDLE